MRGTCQSGGRGVKPMVRRSMVNGAGLCARGRSLLGARAMSEEVKMSKPAKAQPVRGMQDFIGEQAARFEHVADRFRDVGRRFGFRGVQVPVVEFTQVFARTLGETTDVVSKEMYTFEDRNGESLTLRPEFTAGICRAYISEGWQQFAPLKLMTHGPLFRYERPQKGRYRQFHQIDAEVIGSAEPAADVELIAFADLLLKELGVAGVTLQLNTLGDAETRGRWRDGLVRHFSAHRDALSEESRKRLETNPLRILDSKEAQDRPLVEAGMVYVTLPPLFVVKDGTQRIYCQDESERDTAVAQLKATSKRKVEVQRNKGLGEMDADDFWNTVLDPQRRTVIRVHLDDAEKKLHHTLFGGPPEGRRSWMAEVAAVVDTLALDLD